MTWIDIADYPTSGNIDNFKKTIQLVLHKPQVLTKWFAGGQILCERDISSLNFDQENSFLQNVHSLALDRMKENDVTQWDVLIQSSENLMMVLEECIPHRDGDVDQRHDTVCILQYTIPKSGQHAKILNCYLVREESLTCIPVFLKDGASFSICHDDVYRISYTYDGKASLSLSLYGEKKDPKNSCLLSIFNRFKHFCDLELTSVSNQTLRLVNFDKYNDLYNRMKEKYANSLIENWTESTDPKKFVFEDIAIASYLMLIFEEERLKCGLDKMQTFLDIGCGNGLLVYLLNSEGYHGSGIDIRKRKIWDWFGENLVDLKERTLTPSDDVLFPEYDWLIGNHSDEMTPWIPVISARSSYQSRFFVLPCCPHDFNGKFRERKSNLSVYKAYLDYVEEIVEMCGFESERDMLKIPSTKRTCIIGRKRNYQESEEADVNARRTEFIQSRCQLLLKSNGACPPSSPDDLGFIPREKEEKVRNCTKLDPDLKIHIVKSVFQNLLETKDEIEINDRTWNRGASRPLSDLADNFDKETLKKLKNECGGLQTLLKNHHHIFRVVGGQVGLRCGDDAVKRRKSSASSAHRKTCLCFFHENHPDGCWQPSERCNYAHGENELRKFAAPT